MIEKLIYLTLFSFLLLACQQKGEKPVPGNAFLADVIPNSNPLDFSPVKVPEGMLIHRGVFSPDFSKFYYTLSPPDFSQFDIYVMEKVGDAWNPGRKASFNSEHFDHGMSFSPDGKKLYFSSSRPIPKEGFANSWHIWKVERAGESWGEAQYVEIPNLQDKLLSHPSIGKSGRLYFHASNLDFSEMHIYYADLVEGNYQEALKWENPEWENLQTCTPYISPNEDFLIFATISNHLDLMISHKTTDGKWTKARKLNEVINTKGQGNPYLSPDQKFLFYAAEGDTSSQWTLKWVNIESELKKD